MITTGIVYLIGAGPGDPELITLKGLKFIKKCDVIIYDRLISFELLNYTKDNCEKIYVGKKSGEHSMKQEEINKLIIEKANENKIVVRLKGGDSFVFGRGGEEIEAIKAADIYFEVIPGITSCITAPECFGIPVTHRGISQSFHVMTGHTAFSKENLPEDFKKIASLSGTLIFLMGIENISKIVKGLLISGKDESTKCAVISNATTSKQKIVKSELKNLIEIVKNKNITSPAVIVIGDVCKLEMMSNVEKELKGIKIGINGTKHITEKLYEAFIEKGAEVETICKLNIIPSDNNEIFSSKLKNLSKYTWIAFTSANAVKLFFKKLSELKIDFRNLYSIKFAVIGEGTAEILSDFGFYADYIPKEFSAEALANGISTILDENDFMLLPRALKSSKVFNEILEQKNKHFDDIVIYDVIGVLDNERMISQITGIDYLIFASSSGVEEFFKHIKEKHRNSLNNIKIVSIGDITEKTLKKYGCNNLIIADKYSVDGIVDSICKDNIKNK